MKKRLPAYLSLFTFLLFAKCSVQQEALSGYRIQFGQRCTEGTSVRIGDPIQDDIRSCASLCNSYPECHGFNLRLVDRTCIARTAGCITQTDPNFSFYVKFQDGQRKESTSDGYKIEYGMRCSGDSSSKIGDTLYSLDRCKALCSMDPDCFVINWNPGNDTCIVRTSDCSLEPDLSSQLYRKEVNLGLAMIPNVKPVTTQTPAIKLLSLFGPRYYVVPNRACDEASQIGEVLRDVNLCHAVCDVMPNCLGYTLFPKVRTCMVNAQRCTPEKANGALFYHKLPQETPSSPATSLRTPALLMRQDFATLLGFDKKDGVRCVGGVSLGDTYADYRTCASSCRADPTCYGINVLKSDGSCSMRTSDCLEETSANAFFYSKTRFFTTAPPPSISQVSGFDARDNERCSGGSRIGDILSDYRDCASSCRSYPECYGFNLQKSDGSCAMKTSDCAEEGSDQSIFYAKIAFSAPRVEESLKEISGFYANDNVRCAGGSRLGEVSVGYKACASSCRDDPSCYGFNYQKNEGACAMKKQDCAEEGSNQHVFYAKIAFSAPRAEESPKEISGFYANEYVRCAGGSRLGEVSVGYKACASSCRDDPSCYGFNYQKNEGACVMKTSGCTEESSDQYVFYVKYGFLFTPEPSNQYEPSRDLPGFDLRDGVRCVGGSRLGDVHGDLKSCQSACFSDANCYGFNFQKRDRSCALRTSDCGKETNEQFSFYEKSGYYVPEATSPTQIAGFDARDNVRCVKGSRLGDIYSDYRDCVSTCRDNPNCYGFNLQKDGGTCAMRTWGCIEEQTREFVFYAKSDDFNAALHPAPSMTVSGFDLRDCTRCIGGSRLGEVYQDINNCQFACYGDPNCYGFNMQKNDGSCALRTSDCAEEPDDQFVFYKKSGYYKPQAPTRPSKVEGFEAQDSVRCTGWRMGDIYSDYRDCAATCRDDSSCYGFNLQKSDGTCTLRAVGCAEASDDQFVFYVKSQDVGAPQTSSPIEAISDFDMDDGTRCVGGSRLGDVYDDVWSCQSACYNDPDCYGFNLQTTDGSCALRASDCSEEANGQFVFYHKRSTMATTAAPIAMDVPGFYMKTSVRCVGGSRLGDVYPNYQTCARSCNDDLNCGGFNMQKNGGSCAMRTSDCAEETDELYIFYSKLGATTLAPERTDASAIQLPGFDARYNVRCSGGSRLGDVYSNVYMCASACAGEPYCSGFNFQTGDGSCAMRDYGCSEEQNDQFTFYRRARLNYNTNSVTANYPYLQTDNRYYAWPTPEPQIRNDYDVIFSTRCVGGTSVSLGNYYGGLEECKTTCDAMTDCYGFNFATLTNSCTLRSTGCEMAPNPDFSFYRLQPK